MRKTSLSLPYPLHLHNFQNQINKLENNEEDDFYEDNYMCEFEGNVGHPEICLHTIAEGVHEAFL